MNRAALFLAWLCAASLTHAAPVTALAFSPDGKALVHNGDRTLEVRSPADAGPLRSIPCPLPKVCALAFSPDGRWLAAAGGEPGVRGEALMFSWPEGVLKHRFGDHQDLITAIAIDSSGHQLLLGSADHHTTLWALADGALPSLSHTLTGHSAAVLAVAFTPGTRRAVTASADRSLKIWAATDGKLLRSLGQHTEAIHALAFRPRHADPAACASAGDDRTVRVWQPEIGRMVRIVRHHDGPILALAWSPDGRHLFSAGQEGVIRRIDGDSDLITDRWSAAKDWIFVLAVSPDGTTLAAGDWSGHVTLHRRP